MLTLTKNEADFADYLASLWDSAMVVMHPQARGALPRGNSYLLGSFRHEYPITNHRCWSQWKAGIMTGTASQGTAHTARRSGFWWCGSLREAALHYSWTLSPVGSFAALGGTLRSAIKSGSTVDTRRACLDIFKWGGVGRKPTDASLMWLDAAAGANTLIGRLKLAKRVLQPSRTIGLSMFHRGGLLMNSAMTKVYAASDPHNIIIYDGRVGAALCLLVREFLIARGDLSVRVDLAFLWGPPQQRPVVMRNPSVGPYVFRFLNQRGVNDRQRAETARSANRVLSAMLSALKAEGVLVPLAEVEKALFMIGYDVRG